MNILILTDELLPGGVSRHVTDLSNALARRGISVTLAATDGPFRARLSGRVSFLQLQLNRPDSYEKNLAGLLPSVGTLRKDLARGAFHVIHTHKRYSDAIGRYLARTKGIPHVSTCHNTFTGGKWLSPFGDMTIAVSRAIEKMLVTEFGKKPETIAFIPNEIEPLKQYTSSKIRQLKRSYGFLPYKKIIVSIGQFIPAKDRMTLLRALDILRKRRMLEGVACLLVGHGNELPFLKKKTAELSLDDSVFFLPGTSNMDDILNMADFCVLSSVRDGGIPYVLFEAASLGKPHVATSVGGIPEFVFDGRTGSLVPPGEAHLLAEAIERLLKEPDRVKRLGKEARKLYKENHASLEFVEKTVAVYERVLEGRGRS